MTKLNDQLITRVMQAYVDAMSGDDVDAVLVLFADDAVVEDPVGSDAHSGKKALRVFYQASIESVESMVLEGSVRARDKWGAAAMIASPKGIDMKVETLDVMEFNDEGLITRMTAYWGDTNLRVE